METYVAIFGRTHGNAGGEVGRETVELYEGEPIDRLSYYGTRYRRVSDLVDGTAHYMPEQG